LPPPPLSTLFPYTTLFRSTADSLVRGASIKDAGLLQACFSECFQWHETRFQGLHATLPLHSSIALTSAGDRGHCPSPVGKQLGRDRKSTRLNSSHVKISYA